MSKSADRRERACDGSLAACPLRLSRVPGGRQPLSCDCLGEWTCVRGQREEGGGGLKTCGPLQWRTSYVYLQRSFVSMNSSMTTLISGEGQALVQTCSWEAFGQFAARRDSQRSVTWKLRRPHQLIHWHILHDHFTAVTCYTFLLNSSDFWWVCGSSSSWLFSVFSCINVRKKRKLNICVRFFVPNSVHNDMISGR